MSLSFSDLCVAQLNANSLLGHIDYIRAFFINKSYHIISVSETWLKPNIPDSLVSIDGYFLLRNDRLLCMGGGVACYVHNSLKASILNVSSNDVITESEYLI